MRNLDREMLHGNAETLVLASLAKNDCHGYQIRKEMAAQTRHYFQFAFGRLYPMLRSLEKRGLVAGRWEKIGKARRRRLYAITAKGAYELRLRKRKWGQFAKAMDKILA
jgi:PadR family transcriptional regulator PadR